MASVIVVMHMIDNLLNGMPNPAFMLMAAGVGLELADYVQCRQAHSCGRPDKGFGVIDLGYDLAGAAVTELLIAGLKRVPGLKRLL